MRKFDGTSLRLGKVFQGVFKVESLSHLRDIGKAKMNKIANKPEHFAVVKT